MKTVFIRSTLGAKPGHEWLFVLKGQDDLTVYDCVKDQKGNSVCTDVTMRRATRNVRTGSLTASARKLSARKTSRRRRSSARNTR